MTVYLKLASDLEFESKIMDPFDSLHGVIVFSPRDWGAHREEAWIYGIVVGWGLDAMAECAARFGWDAGTVRRLRLLHLAFRRAQVHGGAS